jgi:hypothetical protein
MRKNCYKQRVNIMEQHNKRTGLLRVQEEKLFENKIFRGKLKLRRHELETASAVLMKHLVESDKEGQAEPPVDPIDAFFKIIAAAVKTSPPPSPPLPIARSRTSLEYLLLYMKRK